MATDHLHADQATVVHLVAGRLSECGQRFTTGRRQVVSALASAGRPLSIPEMLEASPLLAQSSAYRNLSILEQAGVVARVVTTDEWVRFELSEDITGHHHHMVCSECGSVDDVRIPDEVESELDKVLARVASRAGFEMAHHRLDVVGVCKSCR